MLGTWFTDYVVSAEQSSLGAEERICYHVLAAPIVAIDGARLLIEGGEAFEPTGDPDMKAPSKIGDYVTVQPNWFGVGKPSISWLTAEQFLRDSRRVDDVDPNELTVFRVAPKFKDQRLSDALDVIKTTVEPEFQVRRGDDCILVGSSHQDAPELWFAVTWNSIQDGGMMAKVKDATQHLRDLWASGNWPKDETDPRYFGHEEPANG